MVYCFVYQNLHSFKKKRTFLRVQSGSLGTAAIPDFHTILYILYGTSYRRPSCTNSAVWIRRVLESCGKNLTYMDCMSCFKGSKIYYVYYGTKNKCCCVGYKGRKTKPQLFNILGNNRDAKLSVNVRTLRGVKNVTRCMFSLAIVSRKRTLKFSDISWFKIPSQK